MDPEQAVEVISKENKFLQLPATVTEIITAMETYQDLVTKLLVEDDYVVILKKKCIKKSGWLKLALAFNLSTKILKDEKEFDPNDSSYYSYHITVECIAPNGRTTSEVGTCDTIEKNDNEHVIHTMAMTRAKSRAIASMIGASESSAEEMESVKTTIAAPTPLSQPTEQQLQTLKDLGYTGPRPESKLMASNIIIDKKNDAKEDETKTTTSKDKTSVDCICDNSIPSSVNPNICQTCGKLLEGGN